MRIKYNNDNDNDNNNSGGGTPAFGGGDDFGDYGDYEFNKGGIVGMQEGGQVPVAPPQEAMPMPSGQPAGFVNDPSAAPAPDNPMDAMQGEGRQDDVMGELPEGTFVINAMAVQLAGIEKLDTMVEKAYETLSETMREKGIDESLVTQLVGSSRSRAGMRDKMVDVAVSNGEYIVPPEIVGVIGEDKLRKINDRGLRKLEQKEKEQKQTLESGGFVKLADGDVVRKFTGSFNSDTERLKNINGKTFVVSKGSETKTKPVSSSPTSTMMQSQDQKADIPSDLILSSAQDPSKAPPPSGAKPFSTSLSEMEDLNLIKYKSKTDLPNLTNKGAELDQSIIESKTPTVTGSKPTLDESIIETKTQPKVKKTNNKSSMLLTEPLASSTITTLEEPASKYARSLNETLLANDIKYNIDEGVQRGSFLKNNKLPISLEKKTEIPRTKSVSNIDGKSVLDFKYYDTQDILYIQKVGALSDNPDLTSAMPWIIHPRTSNEELDFIQTLYDRSKASIAVNAKNQGEAGMVLDNIVNTMRQYIQNSPYQSVKRLGNKYIDKLTQGITAPRTPEELKDDFDNLEYLREFGIKEDEKYKDIVDNVLKFKKEYTDAPQTVANFFTQGSQSSQLPKRLFQSQQPFMPSTKGGFDTSRPRDTGPDVQTFSDVGDLSEDDRNFSKTILAMSDNELEKLLNPSTLNKLPPIQKRIVLQEQYRRLGFLDRKMPVTKSIAAPTASLDLEKFKDLSIDQKKNQLASIVQSVTMPNEQQNTSDGFVQLASFDGLTGPGLYDIEGDFPEKINVNDNKLLNSLYTRLIQKENSSYDFEAKSNKGAKGFAQLMSNTVKDPGAGIIALLPENEQQYLKVGESALTNPVDNLLFGFYYLKALLLRYDGDVAKALSSYNYGLGNTDKLIKKHGNKWVRNLPDETEDYISTIKGYLGLAPELSVPKPKPTQVRVGGFV